MGMRQVGRLVLAAAALAAAGTEVRADELGIMGELAGWSGASSDELDAMRGRNGDSSLNATIMNNENRTASSVALPSIGDGATVTLNAGATNAIGGAAFSGAQGFVTVIQNAANNVVIQNVTSYTVNFVQ